MDKLEQVEKILSDYQDDATLVISTAYSDGGDGPIIPRLERAVINQIEASDAVYSRYGIWANTVRDNLLESIKSLDAGDIEATRKHLVRSVNGLSAFADLQALLESGD